jgi:protein-disulfide isomerase
MNKTLGLFGTLAITCLAACADPDLSKLASDIAVIKQQQTETLQKINALETAVKTRPAQPAQPAQPPAPQGPFTIPAQNATVLGDPKAPAVIIAWSDFQCPFCSKILPMIDETLKDPEMKGKVSFVFKQYPLPFHKQAVPAARAALSAGRQGKFFEMHDKIFANQQQLADDKYAVWAKELGLNVSKFEKDMADPAFEAQIKADMEEGAKVGVRGTPSLYVGTKSGDTYTFNRANERSPEYFKRTIKELLKK